jgi:hypothetical protein
MTASVKVGGAWRSFAPKVKVGGAWKSLAGGWVKVAGVWRQFVGAAAPLDTQTVTTGNIGLSPNAARGWSSSGPMGSCADGTSNIYGGAPVSAIYWSENGGGGADVVNWSVTGVFTNTGWTRMVVDGTTTFLRADAAFVSGATTYWAWNNCGFSVATNPFGAAGSVHTVVFS